MNEKQSEEKLINKNKITSKIKQNQANGKNLSRRNLGDQ